MKKVILGLILFLFSISLVFAISIEKVEPDRIYISSDLKEGKVYCNNVLCKSKFDYGKIEILNLWPETEYKFQIVTPSGKEENINCTTTSWQGFYRWINTSDNTNKGHCKELIFYVEKAEQLPFIGGVFYNIYEVIEGFDKKEFRIFPLVDLNETGEYPTYKYQDNNKVSETYRRNALNFNTTSLTPSSFYCSKININPNEYSIEVKTKSFTFKVNTITTYKFVVNKETEKKEVWFILDGDGLAKMGMFKNPVPREGTDKRVFILESI